MSFSTLLAAVATIILLLLLLVRKGKDGMRANGLPPGPPTLPFLGNIHQLPTQYAQVKFTSWAREYGGIFSLKIAHETAIVITSPKIIRDYMDKKSTSTAERPPLKLVDIVTDRMHAALTSGPSFKTMRRAMQMFLTREERLKHLPIQRAEGIQLMYDILKQPEGLLDHIERKSVSIILSTVFGIRSPRYKDSIVSRFVEGNRKWESILEPATAPPLDLIPILQYVPERWAKWKAACREIRVHQRALYFSLRDMCQKRIKENRRNGCFMEVVFDQKDKLGLDDDMVGYVGGGYLEGGAGNTNAWLQTAMLLIACHPRVQQKAQQEIDEVVGGDRLPALEDYNKMRYLQATMFEISRFFPPVPLGLPHYSTADETVEGYYIPKGAMILMNYYGIYRDPDLFDLPDRFIPERFLTSEFGTKPGADTTGFRHDLHFGSGRRICPGIDFAEHEIKFNLMNLLWAFNFEIAGDPPRDSDIPVQYHDFSPGITSGPKPFKCNIRSRSETHAHIIRSEYTRVRSVFSMFEQELSPEERAFVESW